MSVRLPGFLAALLAAASAMAEPATIPRGSGSLRGAWDVPPKAPRGGVVLAPGQRYPMDGPILRESAASLAKQGLLVLRLDWGYTTSGGEPSVDGVRELDDLRAALAYLRADPRLKGKPVLLGGKSMGSLVALEVANDAEAGSGLAGLVLLTPLCRGGALDTLKGDGRALFVALGDRDPLCDVGALRKLLPAHARLVVIEAADHGLEDVEHMDRSELNVRRAAEELAAWVGKLVP